MKIRMTFLLIIALTVPSDTLRLNQRIDPQYDIMHIPKTAGTSFEHDASGIVSIPNNGLNWNEVALCKYGSDTKVMTMLRDPTAHVLSQYHHCKDSPTHHATTKNIEYMPDSFDLWIDQWHDAESSSTHPALKQKELAQKTCCYNPSNLMTSRMMCFANATHDMKTAKERLNSVWFVGLTEYYAQSLCLLHDRATGKLPEECACGSEMKVAHVDWGSGKHSVKNISAATQSKIDAITQEDRELYEAGSQRFFAEVAEVEDRHNVKLLCDLKSGSSSGMSFRLKNEARAQVEVGNPCAFFDETHDQSFVKYEAM